MANRQLIRRKTTAGAIAPTDLNNYELGWHDLEEKLVIKKGDNTVKELNTAAGGGSSDPWTYVELASDESTNTAIVSSAIKFTPEANKSYEFEAILLVRTSSASIAVRVGVNWPTAGVTDSGAMIIAPNAQFTIAGMNSTHTVSNALSASTNMPLANTSYSATIKGMIKIGASPTGDVQVIFQPEVPGAGETSTLKAGSFIRYREIGGAGGGGGGGLPSGGTIGQALLKNSSTDGDAGWQTLSLGISKAEARKIAMILG